MADGGTPLLYANLVIAGVPKAGTSALHRWLRDHPDVVGSSEKETYFFADPGTHMFRPWATCTAGLEGYANYFRDGGAGAVIRVEATPAYIYYREALERIPQLPTQPKCLFVVREPASQIYSMFRYFQSNWDWIPAGMNFRDFIGAVREGRSSFGGNELARDALGNGAYVNFLGPWRDTLGSERFRVATFDEFCADPAGFAKSVAAWAGIAPEFYASYPFPRENETYDVKSRLAQKLNIAIRAGLPKGRLYDALRSAYRSLNTRRPSPPDEDDRRVIEELRQHFRPHNRRLEREFGLDLSRW